MKKTWTRILSFILSVGIMCSVSPLSPFAVEPSVEGSPIAFTITDTKGVADKTVVVEVRVSENSQIASLGIELLFDSSKLLVKSFEAGDAVANGLPVINGNVSDRVIMSYASMEPITSAGTLFSVEFAITDANVNEELGLSLNVIEVTDITGKNLVNSTDEAKIEIVDLLYGDVNFDNRITSVDALMVLAATTEEYVLEGQALKAADVNGNNAVTVSDALQILYFAAELIDDFEIYKLTPVQNLHVSERDGYSFTVEWDYLQYATGYLVYLDGICVNGTDDNGDFIPLTNASVKIGVDSNENYGDSNIPRRVHDSIEQVSPYNVRITALNALKESEPASVDVVTKRIWSWVTFKDWDGREIKKARVYYGEDAIVPNDPVRTDYFFTGWDKPTTNIIDDTVITATYEDAHYDFVFLNEDSSELYRQNVTVNGKATPPTAPTKRGYTFDGWYTSVIGGEKITDFTITSQTGERKAYARFAINTYSANFESSGGSSVVSKTATFSSKISKPTDPTRSGYNFAGWYKERSLSNAWNFNSDVLEENITLYAKWIPIVITIDKPSISFTNVGQKEQLSVSFSSGTDIVKWSSDNTAVATVDANTGMVTAIGHGTANIYIEGQNSTRRAVCKVTVVQKKDAWVVNTGGVGLNLRQYATTGSAALLVIPENAQIIIYGTAQNGWYNASYNGKTGWVSASYVTLEKPKEPAVDASFSSKLNRLKSIYPAGTIWSNNSLPVAGSYWKDGGMYVGYYNGQYGKGSVNGWQCYAFAVVAFIEINGHAPGGYISTNNFNDIRVGDVIHFKNAWWHNGVYHTSQHWMLVTKKDANGVWGAEGNVNNAVRYDTYRKFGTDSFLELWGIRR